MKKETSNLQDSKALNIGVVSNRICCKNCKVLHIFPSGKYRCEKNYIEIKEDINIHGCDYFSDRLS